MQVMTYHDALMTQLKSLVGLVTTLRARLRDVDESALKVIEFSASVARQQVILKTHFPCFFC